MTGMTERGLPMVDSALACPFVAFDDDRDSRATSPDHRHRCYAEVRPAPRALAHQQAYCLSSAFAVCPTFQDWARREAAQARASTDAATAASSDAAMADTDEPDIFRGEPGPQRNPPRDWASPPPWTGGPASSQVGPADDAEDEPDVQVIPARGGGLSGSFADRLAASPSSPTPADAPSPAWSAPAHRESDAAPPPRRITPPVDADGDDEDDDEDADQRATSRRPRPIERRPVQRIAPSWERPPRREAYPTLKTRIGLSGVTLPPIFLGIAAVVIAALALFFLPALLGVGNPQGTPGASPTAGSSGGVASASPAEPTAVPEPTPQVYLVEAGDTMSRIANRFGVPLQMLIDANKVTIPNPDKLTIGQEVIIPSAAPTLVPDAGGSPVPAASPSP